jgi:hypothetical protein
MYACKYYLKKHEDSCKFKEKYFKNIEQLLSEKDQKISKLENDLVSVKKLLQKKDTKYIKLTDKIIDTKICRPNVYNYILNNVKPTTNVHLELSKPLTNEDRERFKMLGAKYAIYEVIYERLVEGRKEDDMILVCFDPSRDKFSYLDKKFNWITDFKLENLINNLIKPILDDIFLKNEFNPDNFDNFSKNWLEYNQVTDGKNKYVINRLKNVTKVSDNFIKNHKKLLIQKN